MKTITTESEPMDMTGGGGGDHSVHIQFCVSWGSKRNFLQVRDWLEQTFPELRGKVTGDNYPPPPIAELLMKFLSLIQLAGMAVALMGENVFRLIGMSRPPSWYGDIVVKNAVPLCIGLYLIVPQILNGYIVSNAFEVVLDGTETIFSKIATGRMPQAEDLIDPLTKFGLMSVGVAPQ
jgi:selT/selW/selH-like putative selenoprotein